VIPSPAQHEQKKQTMKQGTVKFSKEFITTIGLKEWVSVELEYDMATECPRDVLTNAKEIVTQWHQASSPGFPDNSIPPGPPPIIQVQQQDIRIGVLVEDIMSCKELAVLDSYRLMVKGNDELTAAYNKRRSEIVGAEVDDICKKTEEFSEAINEHLKKNPKLYAAYKKRFDK
jgi:hypothetical protein